jgi:AraC-like DNA-binding protein
MTWITLLIVALPLAAAANALLLASTLAHRSLVHRQPSGLYASAFLLVAAGAVVVITLDHSGLLGGTQIAPLVEGILTLASGPLLVMFLSRLLGLRHFGPVLMTPLILFLVAALVSPAWTLDAFTVERLVLVQMGYTAYAAVLALGVRPAGRRTEAARRMALATISAMGLVHIGQLVRMAWPGLEAISNIVPLIGAACFMAAAAFVYSGARSLAPVTDPTPAPSPALEAVARALDDRLVRQGLLRDPALTLAQVAEELGASPAEISRAVLAVRGASFPEYLQRLRVEEAKRLLHEPAEQRTSMEAIGLLSGFGSRSAFYAAFRSHTGLTPSAFRGREVQKTCPNTQYGQDS